MDQQEEQTNPNTPNQAETPQTPQLRKPYKFTKEKQDAYLQALRQGGRRHLTARAIGIDPRTVMRHAEKYPQFAKQIAEAEMEANQLVENALLDTALKGNVTAQQVWLYNRDPQTWADRRAVKTEISGPDGGPIRVAPAIDPREQIVKELSQDALPGETTPDHLPTDEGTSDLPT